MSLDTKTIAPGITVITPTGKDREAIIEAMAQPMASLLIRSRINLDDPDACAVALVQAGWPGKMLAACLDRAISLARFARNLAKELDLTITDEVRSH
jgi:hypothetical protein